VVVFFSIKSTIEYDFYIYQNLFWLVTAYLLNFYKIYRHTTFLRIVNLLFNQFSIFLLGYFAYFGIFREGEIVNRQFVTLSYIFLIVAVIKISWYFLLKKYRSYGNNYRTVVVLGYDSSSKNIIKLFKSKSNLGYKYIGFFSDKNYNNKDFLGNLDYLIDFTNENVVDEIYCSLSCFSKEQIKKLKKFTLKKQIDLKLIPETNELYSKNQSLIYFDDTIPVVHVKKLPFEFTENFYTKRLFDIIFSSIVIILVLSWLIPVLWVLVKLESRGPLIFKQKREGLNGDEFVCYKFRSMKINKDADKIHASKNDRRVTKIGAFLRKTSLDEVPQFLNVLKGDMSVVGPRPHIESLSLEYQKNVEDYMKRHIIKPGITGLAQVSGYRGEIRTRTDIKNRVRLDIFYIENWSFFLDIKIIIKTILNVFQGEENAY
jgi:putative colanic acid biosynthesis UDP-glucose lipid carrier transferase